MGIRKYTKELLEEHTKNNFSIAGVLRDLKLKQSGGNHYHISNRIKEYDIDISHFTGQGWSKGKKHNRNKKIHLEEILVRNSTYARHNLKRRLLNNGMLQNICSSCGIVEWNYQPLNMELDHINGIANDNRIENIRMLCPNCHSLTKTFAGRNKN